MIPNETITHFVLQYGLAGFAQGQRTTLPTLLTEAEKHCGGCTRRELLDALYALRPADVEYQQLISGNRGMLHPIRFERNSVHWEKFFDAEFCIRVLPEGRTRFQRLNQQLRDERPSREAPPADSRYGERLKAAHTTA